METRRCENADENNNNEIIENNDNDQFDHCYVVNSNWMDDPSINVHNILSNSYPNYHTLGHPDYQKLKEGILLNDGKAKEFFKALFRMPHKLKEKSISLDSNSTINNISSLYGENILAHGVEESKGGMCNLLMMAIANCVRVKSTNWGPFIDGMPNISPLCHGPYYIIYSTGTKPAHPRKEPSLQEIKHILVPFAKNKEILIAKSQELVTYHLLDENQHQLFCSKIIDYSHFLHAFKKKKDLNEKPSSSSISNNNNDNNNNHSHGLFLSKKKKELDGSPSCSSLTNNNNNNNNNNTNNEDINRLKRKLFG